MRHKLQPGALVAAALGTVVLLRVLLCLAAPAQLHHSEEFINLRLAAAVLGDDAEWNELRAQSPSRSDGSSAPGLFDYQYQDWDGGTLVVSILLVPIAALGGLTVGTLKAGAILWSLGIAVVWILLLGRLWGESGTRWAAFAVAAVPVPYLLVSSIHWGNHAESALFLPLVLLLLCSAADTNKAGTAAVRVASAGLVAGFGVYFSLLNILPMGLIFLSLPLFFGKRLVMAMPTFAVAGTVGLLPWLGRNSPRDWGQIEAQGVGVIDLLRGAPIDGATAAQGWVHASWPHFGSWDLHGLWSPSGPLGALLDSGDRWAILIGGVVALAAGLARARRGNLERQRLALVVVLVGTYLILPSLLDRSWQLADRRLAPLYPIGWMLLTVAGLSLPLRFPPRRLILALIGGLMVLNLGAGIRLIASWDRPAQSLNPWTHFALPKPAPHLRIEAGIGDLASAEAEEFYERYSSLLESSTSGGEDEMRGLRRAMAPSSGAVGVLHRPPPDCPSEGVLERAPPSDIASTGEARGFGAGLALRCKEKVEDAVGACRQISQGSIQNACLDALGWSERMEGIPGEAPSN